MLSHWTISNHVYDERSTGNKQDLFWWQNRAILRRRGVTHGVWGVCAATANDLPVRRFSVMCSVHHVSGAYFGYVLKKWNLRRQNTAEKAIRCPWAHPWEMMAVLCWYVTCIKEDFPSFRSMQVNVSYFWNRFSVFTTSSGWIYCCLCYRAKNVADESAFCQTPRRLSVYRENYLSLEFLTKGRDSYATMNEANKCISIIESCERGTRAATFGSTRRRPLHRGTQRTPSFLLGEASFAWAWSYMRL